MDMKGLRHLRRISKGHKIESEREQSWNRGGLDLSVVQLPHLSFWEASSLLFDGSIYLPNNFQDTSDSLWISTSPWHNWKHFSTCEYIRESTLERVKVKLLKWAQGNLGESFEEREGKETLRTLHRYFMGEVNCNEALWSSSVFQFHEQITGLEGWCSAPSAFSCTWLGP